MKKTYEVPAIDTIGTIADVTAGFGGPKGDFLFGTPSDGFCPSSVPRCSGS